MSTPTLCIVGLGYVGLPLANAFARAGYETHGYDVSEKRIATLQGGHDWTGELTDEEVKTSGIQFGTDPSVISHSQIIILALPTPVDATNTPDLSLVEAASKTVGEYLRPGAIIVYESTVYPGVTEDICGPILEKASGLTCGKDFTLGYSPERINPGDKEHTVSKILKIVAGQDDKTTDALVALYGSIVTAGIHRAPSIKVAEMAKAIENAQRDLNIAYMNEVAMLCNAIGIPTKDVLTAAGTKWNFLKFQPGLVGGHCIGVDPYYLVEKARQLGMSTNLITAGRSVNDGMGAYVAGKVADHLAIAPDKAKVLVLGLTFKENVPDTRNSKVKDVMMALQARGCHVHVHDPHVSAEEIGRMGLTEGALNSGPYDALLLLVPHKEYVSLPADQLLKATTDKAVIYDLKSLLNGEEIRKAGRMYLAL
jgi:UDP-N-acetyl-D-glucosamine/UDP-N-acetyl-D-galactosamine dehydrogenase